MHVLVFVVAVIAATTTGVPYTQGSTLSKKIDLEELARLLLREEPKEIVITPPRTLRQSSEIFFFPGDASLKRSVIQNRDLTANTARRLKLVIRALNLRSRFPTLLPNLDRASLQQLDRLINRVSDDDNKDHGRLTGEIELALNALEEAFNREVWQILAKYASHRRLRVFEFEAHKVKRVPVKFVPTPKGAEVHIVSLGLFLRSNSQPDSALWIDVSHSNVIDLPVGTYCYRARWRGRARWDTGRIAVHRRGDYSLVQKP